MPNFASPEDFTSLDWAKSGADVNGNVIVAPDGTLTGDRINSIGTSLSFVASGVNAQVLQSGQNAINVFAKEDDSLYGLAIATFNWDPSNGTSYFDLVNGVTGSRHSGHDDSFMELVNGWWLCTILLTTTTDLAGNIRLYVADGDGDATTPVGASIYLWGAYSNAGATPAPYTSEAGLTYPFSSGLTGVREIVTDLPRDLVRSIAN